MRKQEIRRERNTQPFQKASPLDLNKERKQQRNWKEPTRILKSDNIRLASMNSVATNLLLTLFLKKHKMLRQ